MRYITIAFVIVHFLLIIGCKNKECDFRDNKSISNNEIEKKNNDINNQRIKKRYYRKDAAKVDTFPYFADYKGYRYYFPCGPCRDKFIQEREEYLEKWRKKGRKIRKRKLE